MSDPATLAVLLAGGTSLMSAVQGVSAGRISKLESETEAVQIETAAAAREADRKEMLSRATASQAAAAGAGGILFSGSPLTVLEEDTRRAEEVKQRDVLQTRLAAGAARVRGRVALKQAKGKAITGLLQSAASAAGSVGGGPPGAGMGAGRHAPVGFDTGAPSPTFGM